VWENYVTLAVDQEDWGLVVHGLSALLNLSVGLGSRADKSRPLDAHALLTLVDAVLTRRAQVQQHLEPLPEPSNGTSGKSKDADEKAAVAVMSYKNLERQVLALVDRIIAECKSDPKTWKILSILFNGLGQHDKAMKYLLKRCQTTQVDAGSIWDRDHDLVVKVCAASLDFAQYVAALPKDQERWRLAREQVAAVVNRAKVLYAAEPLVTQLERALAMYSA
jgi:hypothetical protein